VARSGNGDESASGGDINTVVAWGLASGLLFLVAASLFAASVTVDGDAAHVCAIVGAVFGLLGAAAMYVTLAAHFEFWPY
jgi:hypothetical protein